MRFLILGANGRTGQLVTTKALEGKHTVTALVRRASSMTPTQGLTIVAGTPVEAEGIEAAFNSSAGKPDAVIFTLASSRASDSPFAKPITPAFFMRDSMRLVLSAMNKHGVHNLVLMSAFGAGDSFVQLAWPLRLLFRYSNMSYQYEDHDAMDLEVRASRDIAWTIVRPVMLKEGAGMAVRGFGEVGVGAVDKIQHNHPHSKKINRSDHIMSHQGGSYYQQPRSGQQTGSQYGQGQQQTQTSSPNSVSENQETSTTTTTTTNSYLTGYQQQAAQAQAQAQARPPSYPQQITQGYQPQYQHQVAQAPQYSPNPPQQVLYQQQPLQYAQQAQYCNFRQMPGPVPQLPPPKPKASYDHLKTKAPRPEAKAKPSINTTVTTTKKKEAVQAQSGTVQGGKTQSGKTQGGTAQVAAEKRGEGQLFQQRVVDMLSSLGVCPAGFQWFSTPKGWLCGGGSHGIKHAEIDQWASDPYYQPKWIWVNHFDLFETNAQGYPVSRLWCPPDPSVVGGNRIMHLKHDMHIQHMIEMGRGMKKENQCACAKAAGMLTKDQEIALTAQMTQGMGGMNGFREGGSGGLAAAAYSAGQAAARGMLGGGYGGHGF
ncbi:hypothetical protein LTR78_010912 [Recurvomyces mirabilis]|uniref:NAD(P)-binding domain-containing protein n=1 Tax=Recurvomyces mirabilis TaxID=574656 RepID=A0AAE0TM83_9PEZI|nr:hypothetical protein LTR78_010912 [Recurvomyces mirabilis]KAK5149911.1 hypothetical protein LTS14_010516 [Recurvomyces mirabilis]